MKSTVIASEFGIFHPIPKEGNYLFPEEKSVFEPPEGDIHVCLVTDTEFTTEGGFLTPKTRRHLTTQIKGIHSEAPSKIYSQDKDILGIPEIGAKKSKYEFHALQYLEDCGLEVSDFQPCKPWEAENLPTLTFTEYSHFSLAELLMTSHGDFQKICLRKIKSRNIGMRRRMFAQTIVERDKKRDFVDFDYKVRIGGDFYRIRRRFIDSCALHGMSGYDKLAQATGIDLPDKHILDDLVDRVTGKLLGKGRMLEIAKQYPKEFVKYALGDLLVYDILAANKKVLEKAYKVVGLKMEKDPKLTIGGTVKDLFETALEKELLDGSSDHEISNIIERFARPGSAQVLSKHITGTKALLAKVEGGRCRNNQPTLINMQGVIVDIDIQSCYGDGQRNQSYPIGNPVVVDYPINLAKNDYLTLRKWLKVMKWGESDCDLIPGLWQLRFSTIEKLKYPQDFFASWFHTGGTGVDILAKYVGQDMKSDTEQVETADVVLDTDDGALKIFEHEIHNGVLTHDGLQWILKTASKRQRNELLDKTKVLCSMHYPASSEIENDIDKLADIYDNWDGFNQTFYNVKTKKITQVIHEPHAWIRLDLGEMLISKLIEERGKAKYQFGKKSPLEQVLKLIINTLYGDMVSKYFAISNTCVGNNITARARAMCWYMEKGFYGVESITDGTAFNLNQVMFNGRDKVNGEITSLHRKKRKISESRLRFGGLGGYKWTGDENGLYADGEHVGNGAENPLVAELAMRHLQGLFPDVDVLDAPTEGIKVKDGVPKRVKRIGQFGLEVKDAYQSMVGHGSANYTLVDFEGKRTLKARGYESKKPHTGLSEEGVIIDRYSDKTPIQDFLQQLESNPRRIKRQNAAVKTGILKPAEYLQSEEKYDALGLMPGDSVVKSLLVTEFSLSQFTFQTHEQYSSWKKCVEKLKNKNNQSIEVFFLNQDGTLDYQKMIETVDEMVGSGVINPLKVLDSQRNVARKPTHPASETLKDFRAYNLQTKETKETEESVSSKKRKLNGGTSGKGFAPASEPSKSEVTGREGDADCAESMQLCENEGVNQLSKQHE